MAYNSVIDKDELGFSLSQGVFESESQIISSDLNLTTANKIIQLIDTQVGELNVFLPPADFNSLDMVYVIRNVGDIDFILDDNGSKVKIYTNESISVHCDGIKWREIW